MFRILLVLSIMIGSLSAVDVRIAKGSYDVEFSIKEFMQHDTTHDIWVFGISAPHEPLRQTPLFYYVDAAFHTSDTKRQRTEFAMYAADYAFPLIGSVNDLTNSFIDMVPVDGDYQTVGFDLNFGLGYDMIQKGESYLGIALNVGATLPNVDAKDLTSNASLAYDLMESWDLDVSTYKIGPALKAHLVLHPDFSLFGSWTLGFQKGAVESALFKSSLDVNGNYNAIDIGLRYEKEPFYLKLGHSYKHWHVNSAEVNLYNFFEADLFSPFDLDLKSSYTYIGVGYDF